MQLKKIILLIALCSSNAYAEGFRASIGGDYSTGKYGTSESTDVFYMPLQLSYDKGPMTFRLTVPYIRVTGPGDFVPGGLGGSGGGSTVVTTTNNCRSINSGSGNSGGSGNGQKICDVVTTTVPGVPSTPTSGSRKRVTESGIGDISAMATLNVLDNADWVVDLTGRVKLPTGSESKGLSNGETDYAVQANVDKYFGAFNLSAGLGYRWLGEPSGVDLDNVTYGSIGGGYKFTQASSVGVSYDWATAAVNGSAKPQEISVFGSYRISDSYKLSAVLYKGLSNSSPDVGGGLTLNYYF